ncbi:unnamed protein product [Caenorhabditis auriculariae]|uniref:Protein-tyrosine-phosphatase n=1 Tax=Caenorhabditis auriculariae TaxID=2777116 RepID=A0A8S1H4K5_9PELO|nr:unnamed protein product [Caenorhabditis auriculariae]
MGDCLKADLETHPLLDCPCCCRRFELEGKQPCLFVQCGHSVCLKCFNASAQCIQCKNGVLQDIIRNQQLLEFLKNSRKQKTGKFDFRSLRDRFLGFGRELAQLGGEFQDKNNDPWKLFLLSLYEAFRLVPAFTFSWQRYEFEDNQMHCSIAGHSDAMTTDRIMILVVWLLSIAFSPAYLIRRIIEMFLPQRRNWLKVACLIVEIFSTVLLLATIVSFGINSQYDCCALPRETSPVCELGVSYWLAVLSAVGPLLLLIHRLKALKTLASSYTLSKENEKSEMISLKSSVSFSNVATIEVVGRSKSPNGASFFVELSPEEREDFNPALDEPGSFRSPQDEPSFLISKRIFKARKRPSGDDTSKVSSSEGVQEEPTSRKSSRIDFIDERSQGESSRSPEDEAHSSTKERKGSKLAHSKEEGPSGLKTQSSESKNPSAIEKEPENDVDSVNRMPSGTLSSENHSDSGSIEYFGGYTSSSSTTSQDAQNLGTIATITPPESRRASQDNLLPRPPPENSIETTRFFEAFENLLMNSEPSTLSSTTLSELLQRHSTVSSLLSNISTSASIERSHSESRRTSRSGSSIPPTFLHDVNSNMGRIGNRRYEKRPSFEMNRRTRYQRPSSQLSSSSPNYFETDSPSSTLSSTRLEELLQLGRSSTIRTDNSFELRSQRSEITFEMEPTVSGTNVMELLQPCAPTIASGSFGETQTNVSDSNRRRPLSFFTNEADTERREDTNSSNRDVNSVRRPEIYSWVLRSQPNSRLASTSSTPSSTRNFFGSNNSSSTMSEEILNHERNNSVRIDTTQEVRIEMEPPVMEIRSEQSISSTTRLSELVQEKARTISESISDISDGNRSNDGEVSSVDLDELIPGPSKESRNSSPLISTETEEQGDSVDEELDFFGETETLCQSPPDSLHGNESDDTIEDEPGPASEHLRNENSYWEIENECIDKSRFTTEGWVLESASSYEPHRVPVLPYRPGRREQRLALSVVNEEDEGASSSVSAGKENESHNEEKVSDWQAGKFLTVDLGVEASESTTGTGSEPPEGSKNLSYKVTRSSDSSETSVEESEEENAVQCDEEQRYFSEDASESEFGSEASNIIYPGGKKGLVDLGGTRTYDLADACARAGPSPSRPPDQFPGLTHKPGSKYQNRKKKFQQDSTVQLCDGAHYLDLKPRNVEKEKRMDLALKLFGSDKKKKDKESGEKREGKRNNVRPEELKRPSSAASSHSNGDEPCDFSQYVKVLEDFIFNTEKLGIDGLSKQYRKLDTQVDPTLSFEAFKQNMSKNRYSDVLCRDSTRVKLHMDATRSGDYIHANYVRTPYLHNAFICTQGPLQSTINDFWRMVFQERASSILMLCRPTEDGRPKCVMYWPEQESSDVHGCIRVTNCREIVDDNNCFEKVDLLVELSELCDIPEAEMPEDRRPLNVTLIKWTNWPDRGVPDEKCHTVPQKVLSMVRHGPCVIHCSAGIGRTGCMVALEFAHRLLSLGRHVDFEKIAVELRKQRAQCIQTEIQYLYIHRVMVAFAAGENGISQKARDAANAFLNFYDDHMKR